MKISIPAYTPRQHSSVWILILMNLVPVYGVLYEGWKAFDIIFIYVAETVIIGLLNAFKMAFCTTMQGGNDSGSSMVHPVKIFLIPFFMVHYFFFVAIQTVFVFSFLGDHDVGNFWELPLSFWQLMNSGEFSVSILCILGSHVFSFLVNYVGNKEYAKIGLPILMFQPYIRIFIQQFVVIFGAILMSIFNTPDTFVLLLVFFKILADVAMHRRIHKKYRE